MFPLALVGVAASRPFSWRELGNESLYGSSGKEHSCQPRTCKRRRFDPWVGKICWSRKWHPTPVFLPGKFHANSSLAVYNPWGHKELDTPEHFWVGNGNPYQYSCLENSMQEEPTVLQSMRSQRAGHDLATKQIYYTHICVLAWRIPRTGEPGGLPSMGSHRVGHNKWFSSSSSIVL